MFDLVKKRKRLTIPEAQYFIFQLINSLCYLHNRNIIHREYHISYSALKWEICSLMKIMFLNYLILDWQPRFSLQVIKNIQSVEHLTILLHRLSVIVWVLGILDIHMNQIFGVQELFYTFSWLEKLHLNKYDKKKHLKKLLKDSLHFQIS